MFRQIDLKTGVSMPTQAQGTHGCGFYAGFAFPVLLRKAIADGMPSGPGSAGADDGSAAPLAVSLVLRSAFPAASRANAMRPQKKWRTTGHRRRQPAGPKDLGRALSDALSKEKGRGTPDPLLDACRRFGRKLVMVAATAISPSHPSPPSSIESKDGEPQPPATPDGMVTSSTAAAEDEREVRDKRIPLSVEAEGMAAEEATTIQPLTTTTPTIGEGETDSLRALAEVYRPSDEERAPEPTATAAQQGIFVLTRRAPRRGTPGRRPANPSPPATDDLTDGRSPKSLIRSVTGSA